MLDIESLKTWAGYKTKSSESYSGIGAKGGSKAWEETYKKIMTSKESISFYLVAAQEHLDAVIAKQFAIETGLENLRKEQDILEIIEPLSSESNDIYMKIINSLGLEAKEGFGDKVKAAGRRVWAAIKEAFRKLRLAITNIIAAIRRWFASLGQGDSSKIYEKKGEILGKLKTVGNKTISVVWPTNKCNFLKTPDSIIRKITKFAGELLNDVNKSLNQAQSTAAGTNKRAALDRTAVVLDKTMDKAITEAFGNGAGAGWKNEKGGIVKRALYGKNPKKKNVKLSDIVTSASIELLAPNTANNMKSASSGLDSLISQINRTLSILENHEKGNENTDKGALRDNLSQISLMRTVVTKIAIMSKDAYTEYFKIRGVVLKAARMVLNGGSTEKEYQKSENQANKNAVKNRKAKF